MTSDNNPKLWNHSEIIDFPIDFNLYPKMKNVKFIENKFTDLY